MAFLLSFLGGALVTGSIVALRSPRSGKANQYRTKRYVHHVKNEAYSVSQALLSVKDSATALASEISTVQQQVAPSVQESLDEFQLHAQVHGRRIQDDLDKINDELEQFSDRTDFGF